MRWPLAIALVAAACSGSKVDAGSELAAAGAEFAIASGRCLACHPATGDAASRLQALPAPPLPAIVPTRAASWWPMFLSRHYAGAAAADIGACLVATFGSAAARPAAVDDSTLALGERLFRQSACTACHPATGVGNLAERTDRGSLVAFLQQPAATRPDLRAHDIASSATEALALASWLLRSQRQDAASAPWSEGLICECFELHIGSSKEPELAGLSPVKTTLVTVLDVAPRSREDHFALRFQGELEAAVAGDYGFDVGSDDGSWLFVDGRLVVENGAIAPFRRKTGSVHLDAGWHAFTVLFTEAEGGQELDVRWSGPGQPAGPIAPAHLRCRTTTLTPPAALPAPAAEAVARGRAAVAAARCGACHACEPLPATPPARPFAQLGDSVCAVVGDTGRGALPIARAAVAAPQSPRAALELALQRDGCRQCHIRDGSGGLSAPAIVGLAAVEDIGDEGRVPPDLTAVGHRLRQAWLVGVLTGERRVRTYMRARMPRLSRALADEYARNFAAVDALDEDDTEPAFDAAVIEQGRRLAGSSGHSCITCHTFDGRRALGNQGMDLTLQFERLRPQWFRQWLLAPAQLRPGTRMPVFWPTADKAALADVAALRAWLSLGRGAPSPVGLLNPGGLVLEPDERPRLHGAFLRGLSARCLAVGSPLRAHYAYDLAHLRLAWLWRGGFLDADGTWSGRAGQLLDPLGQDRAVLPEGCPFTAPAAATSPPKLLGWRLDRDGYPTFRLQIGAAVVEDSVRPRLRVGGAEMVRTVHAIGADVHMALPPPGGPVTALVGDKAVGEVAVSAGATVEVVYRW